MSVRVSAKQNDCGIKVRYLTFPTHTKKENNVHLNSNAIVDIILSKYQIDELSKFVHFFPTS